MAIKINNLCFVITFIGKVEGGDWPHFLWSVSVSREKGHKKSGFTYVTDYKTGLGLSTNGEALIPTEDEVLQSLVLDHDAGQYSFHDFCSNYDYSEDSIYAFEMYRECGRTTKAIKKLFTEEEIEIIRCSEQ